MNFTLIYSRDFLIKVFGWPDRLKDMAFKAAEHTAQDPNLHDCSRDYLIVAHNIPLPWDYLAATKVWTEELVKLIYESSLPDTVPVDVVQLCPQYKAANRNERIVFWANVFAIMAKRESGFKPEASYQEGFSDKDGPVISRGLLQISLISANGYGARLKSAQELHDPITNLRVGVMIMSRWVVRDGVLMGGKKDAWRGGVRYWSVFRDHSSSKPIIVEHLKRVDLYAKKTLLAKVTELFGRST